jgi:hypothetical protein
MAVGLAFYACSAKSGSTDENGLFANNAGFGNGSGWDSSLGGGNFGAVPNTGTGSSGVVFGNTGGASGGRNDPDACPAIRQKPETVTIYKDATVTDTVYTSKPVALFIMQDRSSSMVGVTGDPNSWPNSTTAITAFVNDPKTAGIDIALGVFPPMTVTGDPIQQGDCAAGSDCGTLVVPWGPLPANGPAMIQGYNTANPGAGGACPLIVCLTPTECALRGMINNCLTYQQSHAEQCVAILVTDGAPTTCDVNHPNLVAIVADGHSKGITTYTLGLPGADIAFLNELSNAGGTGQAIDLTQGNAQTFIDALNNIRQTVAVTTSTTVTTSTVISSPLPCAWSIPDVPGGTTFDKDKVNVQFTPPGATVPVDFFRAGSLAECGTTTQDAWYYDDPTHPTKVLACPNTCNGTLHNAAGAEVAVLFGCDSKLIIH